MVKKNLQKPNGSGVALSLFSGIFLVFLLSACTTLQAPPSGSISRTAEQLDTIDPGLLEPGLAVYYMDGFWRNISQMPRPESFLKNGTPGKPILIVNHRFGKKNIFDSGRNRGLGIQMVGFIHFPVAGNWQLRAHSNDGIEVIIRESLVVSDPEWHADRFSDPGEFQVDIPGWFPILLRYFQRKGTATIELYWKPPGETEFTIIPMEAYGHIP